MTNHLHLRGRFEPERQHVRLGEPFSIELVLRNDGNRDAFVFVPHGRADGLAIAVLEGGAHELSGLEREPEAGLVGQKRLPPGGTYRQEFPLSSWLALNEPGSYVLECRISVEAADKGIGEDGRTEIPVEVVSTIQIHVTGPEVEL